MILDVYMCKKNVKLSSNMYKIYRKNKNNNYEKEIFYWCISYNRYYCIV